MKILSTSWFISKWCAGCARDLLLCILWAILAALLILQGLLLTSHQLPLPGWMLRQIETRLDVIGLRAQLGTATLTTSGQIVVDNVQVATATSAGPLVRIGNLNLQLNPVTLLAGQLDITHVSASGIDFLLPALFSPTGRSEAVISNASIAFRPDPKNLFLEHLSGHLANVTFSAHGPINFPTTGQRPAFDKASIAGFVKSYIQLCRRLGEIEPTLRSLETPRLNILLAPDPENGTKAAITLTSKNVELDLSRFNPEVGRVQIAGLRLSTDLPLAAKTLQIVALRVNCDQVRNTTGYEIHSLQGTLNADLSGDFKQIEPRDVIVTAGSGLIKGVPLGSTWASLRPGATHALHGEITTRAIGADWHATADADPNLRKGTVTLAGAVTPFITRKIEDFFHRPHGTLLAFNAPALFALSAEFGPDWKPGLIRGHIISGPVVGHSVPITDLQGDFTFNNNELNATDIYLHQGENIARGIYWMNAKTLDFRFLLTGQLRPIDISGWFSGWWPDFWNNFNLTASVPVADVTVDGQWRKPHLTTVFAGVDVVRPSIKDVAFDHVRTVMFIRPEFYDATELKIIKDGRTAQGTFTRTVDLRRENPAMRTMDFDITSTLDLGKTAKIFGRTGEEIFEPFTFAEPPALHLKGHLDGEASGRGSHRTITMDLLSRGDFALYDFPLYDLSFKGEIRDADIDLTDVQVSFARGQARARALISGTDAERRLRFDAAIDGASIGETINTLEQFFAKQRGELPPPTSKFQHQLADGRLQFQLAADGLYHDPLSFKGRGTIELSSDQLARINLFGGLSQVLSKSPLFSFTALQLKSARSAFVLDQTSVAFPDLKISGNSVGIEGKGTFLLDRKVMDFSAKVYPFGQGKTLLANTLGFVLVPISNVFELKLSGTLDEPNWYFAYGPTNLVYGLTGTKPNETTPAPQPTDETPTKLPPNYLRR